MLRETRAEPGEQTFDVPRWKRYSYRILAAEISKVTRYLRLVIQCGRIEGDSGYLLSRLDCPEKEMLDATRLLNKGLPAHSAVLLNSTVNHQVDIQSLLTELRPAIPRTSRVICVVYNSYLGAVYRVARRWGWLAAPAPKNFVTFAALENISRLAGYEIVRVRPSTYIPWRLLGLGSLFNSVLPAVPILRWMALVSVFVLRPVTPEGNRRPSLSVVIPARNERGNIPGLLQRLPDTGGALEVIFVEGHSTDGTWGEIEKLIAGHKGPIRVMAFQQTGKGKSDAVRLGFSKASGELITILDADLTMPPELLIQFYNAYCDALGDFINGSRLVYPMEGEAMRFLNHLGNIFFSKALSYVLDASLGDSLCGTKLLRRDDYERLVAWRRDFGEFDPFGDFELLFPGATLGLGIIDVPIRYRARTYGSTSISRFRHGLVLLKMTWLGLVRIKMARTFRASGEEL